MTTNTPSIIPLNPLSASSPSTVSQVSTTGCQTSFVPNSSSSSQALHNVSQTNQGSQMPLSPSIQLNTPQGTPQANLATQAFPYLSTSCRSPILRFLVATWLGNILAGIGLLVTALVLAAYSLVLQVMSTRWSLRNDALQSCISAQAMHIYSAYCNSTLAVGVIEPPLLDRELSNSTSGEGIAFQEPMTDKSRSNFPTLLCIVTFWVTILAGMVIVSHFRLSARHTPDMERMRRMPVPSILPGSSGFRLLETPSHDRTVVKRDPRTIPRKVQTPNASPSFPPSIFRSSHFNTAHFRKSDFQTEEWRPEEEYITVSRRKPGHGGRTTAREQTTAPLDHGKTSSFDAHAVHIFHNRQSPFRGPACSGKTIRLLRVGRENKRSKVLHATFLHANICTRVSALSDQSFVPEGFHQCYHRSGHAVGIPSCGLRLR